MPGSIIIKPIEAKLTHNTAWLSKMDPYCTFTVGSSKFKSQVSKAGGQHPQWHETIVIPAETEAVCSVELKDKHLIADDLIGSFDIDLKEIKTHGNIDKWYPVFYKKQEVGEMLLNAMFTSDLADPKQCEPLHEDLEKVEKKKSMEKVIHSGSHGLIVDRKVYQDIADDIKGMNNMGGIL